MTKEQKCIQYTFMKKFLSPETSQYIQRNSLYYSITNLYEHSHKYAVVLKLIKIQVEICSRFTYLKIYHNIARH